jgi:hypothetical protein
LGGFVGPSVIGALANGEGEIYASSEESVGEGESQRCLSMRNLRNFLQVESNDLC